MFRLCLYMLKVPIILVVVTVLFSVYQIICSLAVNTDNTRIYLGSGDRPEIISKMRVPLQVNQHASSSINLRQSLFPRVRNMSLDKNISMLGRIQTTYFEEMDRSNIFMYFQPIISQDEHDFMLFTFDTFIRACQAANITYFLYGGTLLGAYRHHGMIPWDDDIDVMLNGSQKYEARSALSKDANFRLFSPHKRQWKFYHKALTTLSNKPHRWPFIDIFFFSENKTHIWDSIPHYRDDFVFKKSDVFPLQYRPFEEALLPVPCNILNSLKENYLIHVCSTTNYLHKIESGTPPIYKKTVSCTRLYEIYPFVFREKTKDNIIESLLLNGNVTKSVILSKYCK